MKWYRNGAVVLDVAASTWFQFCSRKGESGSNSGNPAPIKSKIDAQSHAGLSHLRSLFTVLYRPSYLLLSSEMQIRIADASGDHFPGLILIQPVYRGG